MPITDHEIDTKDILRNNEGIKQPNGITPIGKPKISSKLSTKDTVVNEDDLIKVHFLKHEIYILELKYMKSI